MPFSFSGLGSVLGGLSGLFGGRDDRSSTRSQMYDRAAFSRAYGKEFGFNPLTLLGNSAGIVPGQSSHSPLASVAMITDGLRAVDDEVSGDADRRRAEQDLRNDLLRIELDQMRGLLPQFQAAAATDAVGGNPAKLGRRAASVVTAPVSTAGGEPAPYDTNLRTNYHSDGQKTTVFEGPDLDSILTGTAIWGWHKIRGAMTELSENNGMIRDRETYVPLDRRAVATGEVKKPSFDTAIPNMLRDWLNGPVKNMRPKGWFSKTGDY